MSFLPLPYLGLVVPCGLPPWSVGFSVPPPPPAYVCGLVCLYVSFIGKDMGVWLQSLSHCESELTSQSSPPVRFHQEALRNKAAPRKLQQHLLQPRPTPQLATTCWQRLFLSLCCKQVQPSTAAKGPGHFELWPTSYQHLPGLGFKVFYSTYLLGETRE